jgi:hypothetical protein
MAQDVEPFTFRIALALTKQKQALADKGGAGVREPPTGGLGALREIFHSFAGPSERDPVSIAVGLDCSNTEPQTLPRDIAKDARDALAFYDDHILVVCNPARGANLGGLVRLAIGGIGKRTSDRAIPHYRVDRASVQAADLLDQRESWSSEHGKFLYIGADKRDVWFWAELLVDSEEGVQNSLDRLKSQTTF